MGRKQRAEGPGMADLKIAKSVYLLIKGEVDPSESETSYSHITAGFS